MRIGINGGGHHRSLDAIRDEARAAARDGFASYWLSQINGPDALTALAVVGAETPGIELGTAIVPTYPRHPIALAMQALTVQAATGGRLVLGIGPSHRIAVEGAWGLSYAKPLAICSRARRLHSRASSSSRAASSRSTRSRVRCCSPRSARGCWSSRGPRPTAP
jgi:alkanesulfonate monooxygenase SsuD/methylene tetrahydromethanopterin reductase-like flavin-dependent oxidoreductase (luciferase family)